MDLMPLQAPAPPPALVVQLTDPVLNRRVVYAAKTAGVSVDVWVARLLNAALR